MHARGAVLAIEADVIERGAISRPYDGARRLWDSVRQFRHAGEVAYPNGEKLGAGLIRAPCQQLVVGRMRSRAEAEECLADRECIAVDQDLANAAAAGLTANQWMLAAVAIAGEIRERTVGRRYASVVLLDAAFHLCNKRLLQRHSGAEHCIRIGILVLEMRADRRIEQARVAHYRLPIGVLEPGKLVGKDDPMPGRLDRRRC